MMKQVSSTSLAGFIYIPSGMFSFTPTFDIINSVKVWWKMAIICTQDDKQFNEYKERISNRKVFYHIKDITNKAEKI